MTIPELDGAALAAAMVEDEPLFVDLWAPWCAPCRTLRPHLERLSDDYADRCRFVAVNVEEHEDVGRLFDVQSVPTMLLLHRGETLHRFNGAAVPSSIAAQLDRLRARPH